MATRSTVPDVIERGDKLIESRELMIICLILDMLICISLLAVQVSTEVKKLSMMTYYLQNLQFRQCGIVYNLCRSQAALLPLFDSD